MRMRGFFDFSDAGKLRPVRSDTGSPSVLGATLVFSGSEPVNCALGAMGRRRPAAQDSRSGATIVEVFRVPI
jgi:hypothetical protein